MQDPGRNSRTTNGITQSSADNPQYIGRFAPSPTGLLHLGSLFTALASYLDAKARQGLWLLRIDDLDTPRTVKGTDTAILTTLETFGLHWDGAVYYQSQHLEHYAAGIEQLAKQNLLYPCYCSRKTLAVLPILNPDAEAVYPNHCRNLTTPQIAPFALRIKTDARNISFTDVLQGYITENLATQHGDFIVKRKDNVFAYQLAVVIDDYLQGVNHIVRGADLLSATIKQLYLHECLTLYPPNYLHVPIITNPDGGKLSKKYFAPAVDQHNKQHILFNLLQLLKQNPPLELKNSGIPEQLDWAISHWQPAQLKNISHITPEFPELL